MRAGRADREDLIATPHKQHSFIANMALEHAPVCQIV
jgi:hypothetical protein